jgi:hypothetical protein
MSPRRVLTTLKAFEASSTWSYRVNSPLLVDTSANKVQWKILLRGDEQAVQYARRDRVDTARLGGLPSLLADRLGDSLELLGGDGSLPEGLERWQ